MRVEVLAEGACILGEARGLVCVIRANTATEWQQRRHARRHAICS